MKKILILGNVSSGKSSFINSFLKYSILPTSNLVCTSKEIEIKVKTKTKNYIYADTKDHKYKTLNGKIDLKNKMEKSKENKIKIVTSSKHKHLNNVILYDSPGINNSMNMNHKDITFSIFSGNEFSKIFLVMNAENLCTTDDERVLTEIRKKKLDRKLHIIINKIDKILLSETDTVDEIKESVRKFLERNKINKYDIDMYSSIYFELLKEENLDKKLKRQLEILEEFIGKKEFIKMKRKILMKI